MAKADLWRARLAVKTLRRDQRQLPRRGKGEAVSFLRGHIESRHSVDTAYFPPHLLLADPCYLTEFLGFIWWAH